MSKTARRRRRHLRDELDELEAAISRAPNHSEKAQAEGRYHARLDRVLDDWTAEMCRRWRSLGPLQVWQFVEDTARSMGGKYGELAAETATRLFHSVSDDLREEVEKALRDDKEAREAADAQNPQPGNGALWAVLCRIRQSGLPLWAIDRLVRYATREEREELRPMLQAMIMQAIDRRLAGGIPGLVIRRHHRAKA